MLLVGLWLRAWGSPVFPARRGRLTLEAAAAIQAMEAIYALDRAQEAQTRSLDLLRVCTLHQTKPLPETNARTSDTHTQRRSR
jgi:hypothetical protein